MMKKNEKIMEMLAIFCTLVFTLVFFYIANTTEVKAVTSGIKSMDFPKFVLGIQLFLLAVLTVNDVISIKKQEENTQEEEQKVPLVEKKVLFSIVGILVYTIGWNVLGFCLSSFLFFSYEAYLLDREDKIWKVLLLGLIITAVIYLIFGVGFKVSFPEPLLELLLEG